MASSASSNLTSSIISSSKVSRTSNGILKKKKLCSERSFGTLLCEDFGERVALINGGSRLAKVQRFLAKKH
jgi:hypothetical protein